MGDKYHEVRNEYDSETQPPSAAEEFTRTAPTLPSIYQEKYIYESPEKSSNFLSHTEYQPKSELVGGSRGRFGMKKPKSDIHNSILSQIKNYFVNKGESPSTYWLPLTVHNIRVFKLLQLYDLLALPHFALSQVEVTQFCEYYKEHGDYINYELFIRDYDELSVKSTGPVIDYLLDKMKYMVNYYAIDLVRIFQEFDLNRYNLISKEDFYVALNQRIGVHITPQEIDSVFNMLDVNKEGVIQYLEFIRYYISYTSEFKIQGGEKGYKMIQNVEEYLMSTSQTLHEVFGINEEHKIGSRLLITKEEFEEGFKKLKSKGVEVDNKDIGDLVYRLSNRENMKIDFLSLCVLIGYIDRKGEVGNNYGESIGIRSGNVDIINRSPEREYGDVDIDVDNERRGSGHTRTQRETRREWDINPQHPRSITSPPSKHKEPPIEAHNYQKHSWKPCRLYSAQPNEMHTSQQDEEEVFVLNRKIKEFLHRKEIDLQGAFLSVDNNHRQFLSIQKLKEVFRDVGLPLSQHQFTVLLEYQYLVRDPSGDIKYSYLLNQILGTNTPQHTDHEDHIINKSIQSLIDIDTTKESIFKRVRDKVEVRNLNLQALFLEYDMNVENKGYVSKNNFLVVLRSRIGVKVMHEDIQEIFEEVPITDTGLVNYKAFVELVLGEGEHKTKVDIDAKTETPYKMAKGFTEGIIGDIQKKYTQEGGKEKIASIKRAMIIACYMIMTRFLYVLYIGLHIYIYIYITG